MWPVLIMFFVLCCIGALAFRALHDRRATGALRAEVRKLTHRQRPLW